MELVRRFIDVMLHLDRYLHDLILSMGGWVYLILFAVVFCETGLVVTPFLPGDSLLFAIGALAALGALDLWVVLALLFIAAVAGDTVNYWAGNYFGPRVFTQESRFLNHRHLVRTEEFYERHGGKTIILARFIPIIRTFAPFVAGVGSMSYGRFLVYNVLGGFVWVFSFVLAGYFFGNIPLVKKNFTMVILAIIFLSILPGIIEFVRHRRRPQP
jgi:membrane-associated protein